MRRTGTQRGYTLPLVIIFLTILAVSCVAALIALHLSTQATASVIGRRQAFYQCDDVTRIASVAARDYLKTTSTPTDADLKLAVCGSTSGCPNASAYAGTGFSVNHLTVALSGTQVIGGIPNGPFMGMVARQNDVSIDVKLTKTLTGDRCGVRQSSTVAELNMVAFFVIVDGYGGFHAPSGMTFDGRVHVNGDACVRPSGAGDLVFSRITVAKQLKANACARAAPPAGGGAARILDVNGTPVVINGTNDGGCTSCAGGPFAWRTYALLTWNNDALDVDHSVPPLRLPAAETAGVPDGRDASNAPSPNVGSMRVVLDAVRATDSAELRQLKLAAQADVRILNGVWYMKDTANPNSWPGIPIWSDHPGDFTTTNDEGIEGNKQVGQDNLYPGLKPALYSHYEMNAAGINDDGKGVVSYGALLAGQPAFLAAGVLTPAVAPGDRAAGARSGFFDGRAGAAVSVHGDILPLNFDVDALRQALAAGGNELGGKVPAFNGIVWVGLSWPNAHKTGPAVGPWPNISGPNDVGASVPAPTPGQAKALPFNLCTNAPLPLGPGYTTPPCSALKSTRPNAVRIINASSLAGFPNGLTIASNGPVYVQGDFGSPGGGAPNAVRAWIAGDAVTMLSAGWNDGQHPYGGGLSVTSASGNTAIAAAVLTGNVEASAAKLDGGVENAIRLLEDWGGRQQSFQGALQVGFRSVFATQPFTTAVFVSPARNWKHDPGFASNPDGGPPGAPQLFVQAIKNWQRD